MNALEHLEDALAREHARQLELAPPDERPALALDQRHERERLRALLDDTKRCRREALAHAIDVALLEARAAGHAARVERRRR